ncbi:hypothetical protein PISMIDRAFT_689157 [Pisolithus microcarpus 441]|uniref:Uncharacterized protein n=1 Tax=Pisolithus microcarpus 441 TaxID=765257 RepID=A0A0C9YY31_9AGAM|nr:hypothetical protein PISMIDRAFT_689157 [Pisolithus microcarpus 441]
MRVHTWGADVCCFSRNSERGKGIAHDKRDKARLAPCSSSVCMRPEEARREIHGRHTLDMSVWLQLA